MNNKWTNKSQTVESVELRVVVEKPWAWYAGETKPLFSEASAILASSSCTDYIFKRLYLRTDIKSEDYLHSSGEKYHLIMTYMYMYLISSIVLVKQQTSVDPF